MPAMIHPRLLSWIPEEQIESQAFQQLKQLSTLPFIHNHVAVMPDCHFGLGATIGSCIPTKRAIIPAAVGIDIGCGMTAVRTPFTRADLPEDLSTIRQDIENSIPLSHRVYNQALTPTAEVRSQELEHLAEKGKRPGMFDRFDRNWRLQIGSLGSGNHFIEITLDEQDRVWTFLHSGSRGVGNRVARFHIKTAKKMMERWFIQLPNPDLAYLVQDTQEFKDYLADLKLCQEFAFENRAEMTQRVLNVLELHLGRFKEEERIDCHHNFTQWEHHNGENILVTRKGAIQALEGQMGLIPGSMGTRSYVVRGKGNRSALSTAPHGAGRRMSRHQARATFSMENFERDMQGIEVRHSPEFIDELPGAYKDIDLVMEQSKDLVEVVHTFRQIINVKGDAPDRSLTARRQPDTGEQA